MPNIEYAEIADATLVDLNRWGAQGWRPATLAVSRPAHNIAAYALWSGLMWREVPDLRTQRDALLAADEQLRAVQVEKAREALEPSKE